MHSSRMRTARSSSRLLGGCVLGYPPGVGLETPPSPDPSTSPLGGGPGDLQYMLGYHHPQLPSPPPRTK